MSWYVERLEQVRDDHTHRLAGRDRRGQRPMGDQFVHGLLVASEFVGEL
jgi:hypothetical protein